jgi:hypothetical protein
MTHGSTFRQKSAPAGQAPDRATVMRVAAETGLDPRTVKRALELGVDVLRGQTDRERFAQALEKLGVTR